MGDVLENLQQAINARNQADAARHGRAPPGAVPAHQAGQGGGDGRASLISRDSTIQGLRKSLYNDRLGAIRADVEATSKLVVELARKPNWDGLKFVRARKADIEQRGLRVGGLREDYLNSILSQRLLEDEGRRVHAEQEELERVLGKL